MEKIFCEHILQDGLIFLYATLGKSVNPVDEMRCGQGGNLDEDYTCELKNGREEGSTRKKVYGDGSKKCSPPGQSCCKRRRGVQCRNFQMRGHRFGRIIMISKKTGKSMRCGRSGGRGRDEAGNIRQC